MLNAIFTFLICFLLASIVIVPLILLYFWWLTKKIIKNIPKDEAFKKKIEEQKKINKEVEDVREKKRREFERRRKEREQDYQREFGTEIRTPKLQGKGTSKQKRVQVSDDSFDAELERQIESNRPSDK